MNGNRLTAAVTAAAVGGTLGAAVLAIPDEPGGLTTTVTERVPDSGVTHPVTAVLLNFRAYDTWLEVGVLLLAAVALTAVVGDRPSTARRQPAAPVVLGEFTRWVGPILGLTAVFLLSRGTFQAGGAFQAGAVLAAAALLLWLAGTVTLPALDGLATRVALVVGSAAFLGMAAATVGAGSDMLAYPAGWAGALIVAVEGAVTASVAATLAYLFVAAHPRRPGGPAGGSP